MTEPKLMVNIYLKSQLPIDHYQKKKLTKQKHEIVIRFCFMTFESQQPKMEEVT